MHFHHLVKPALKNPFLMLGASSWTVLSTETCKKYPVEEPSVVPVTSGRKKGRPLDLGLHREARYGQVMTWGYHMLSLSVTHVQ